MGSMLHDAIYFFPTIKLIASNSKQRFHLFSKILKVVFALRWFERYLTAYYIVPEKVNF